MEIWDTVEGWGGEGVLMDSAYLFGLLIISIIFDLCNVRMFAIVGAFQNV